MRILQRRITMVQQWLTRYHSLICCVRPNPAASVFRAVGLNQRSGLFGGSELNYTSAGLRRCEKRYTSFELSNYEIFMEI
jgi:hypothetical protein